MSLFSTPKVNTPPNPNQTYSPIGFNAGDITAGYTPGQGFNLGTGTQRSDLLGGYTNDLQGTKAGLDSLGINGGLLGNAYESIQPGFNQLLQTQLSDLGDQARSAMGNLQQNLSARRIMGSSFGNDTMGRLAAEFGKQRDATIGDNFMKSLAAQQSIIQQATDMTLKQAALTQSQYQAGIDALNLPVNVATQLTSGVNSQLASNAQAYTTALNQANIAQAQANSASNTGIGSLFGTAAGLVTNPFGLASTSLLGKALGKANG